MGAAAREKPHSRNQFGLLVVSLSLRRRNQEGEFPGINIIDVGIDQTGLENSDAMRVASPLCQRESFQDYHLGEGDFSVTLFGAFSGREFDRLGFFENIYTELNIFVIMRGREMVIGIASATRLALTDSLWPLFEMRTLLRISESTRQT